jgi:hypothetical protein
VLSTFKWYHHRVGHFTNIILQELETDSNLYGVTTNPLNRNLTPGGSSGGEAALIAMHGSILGIGTDIGMFLTAFIATHLHQLITFQEDPSVFQLYRAAFMASDLP